MKRFILIFFISVIILCVSYGWYYKNRDYTEIFLKRKGNLESVKDSLIYEDDKSRKFYVILKSSSNLKIDCYIKIPKTLRKTYPAIILIAGMNTGKRAIDFTFVDDIVLISFDYPYYGSKQLNYWGVAKNAIEIRDAIFNSVSGTILVVDYLKKFDIIDKSKICVLGLSFGTAFAVIASAIDERIKATALVHGGGDNASLIAYNVKVGSNFVRNVFGKIADFIIAPMEPLRYIDKISPRPLLLLNATDDERIPLKNIELLHQKAKEPKKIVWIESKHMHTKNVELINKITEVVTDWLKEIKFIQ
jgi:fermentation-respiration switch protein FrsA (DUF1100 family)